MSEFYGINEKFFNFRPGGNILCNIRRIGRFHFSIDFFYHPPNRKGE
jgi:hypothetical protein